jgi:hypothetical protein
MKSLIVIYIPTDNTPSSKKDRKNLARDFNEKKPEGSEMLLIEDPSRKKVEVQVFFNPY